MTPLAIENIACRLRNLAALLNVTTEELLEPLKGRVISEEDAGEILLYLK